METVVVAVVIVGLLSLVVLAILAACTRTVPEHSVDVVSRYGKAIGVRRPGRYLVIPLIDGVETILVAPFNRQVADRAFTADGLDVFVQVRLYLSVTNVERFVRSVTVFNDRHENIVRSVIVQSIGERSHNQAVNRPGELRDVIAERVAVRADEFGLTLTRFDLEGIAPSQTGVPARRVVGAMPARIPGLAEALNMGQRNRDAILDPPPAPRHGLVVAPGPVDDRDDDWASPVAA